MLYKKKYLIVELDSQGEIIALYDNVSDLAEENNISYQTANRMISRVFNDHPKKVLNFILVDCVSVHDDIFNEEDVKFLDFVNSKINITKVDLLKQNGICFDLYYKVMRKKEKTLKNL